MQDFETEHFNPREAFKNNPNLSLSLFVISIVATREPQKETFIFVD